MKTIIAICIVPWPIVACTWQFQACLNEITNTTSSCLTSRVKKRFVKIRQICEDLVGESSKNRLQKILELSTLRTLRKKQHKRRTTETSACENRDARLILIIILWRFMGFDIQENQRWKENRMVLDLKNETKRNICDRLVPILATTTKIKEYMLQ